MAYLGDGFLETTITAAGDQAWLLQQQTIRPGAYRMLARLEKLDPSSKTAWRVEPVQGNRNLSGVNAALAQPAIFGVTLTEPTGPVSSYLDLGVVTLPARAGTLSVEGGVAVPLGVRLTRMSAGTDQIRVDAIALLPVTAGRIRDTQAAIVELNQTTASGDATPGEDASTALVLDGDEGTAWIESAQGIEAGIPGVRGAFPRLRPGYDNVLYLLHQTGARLTGPAADYLSDDPDQAATVQITYTPAYTFGVSTDPLDDGEEE